MMNNDLTRREFVSLITAGAMTVSTGIRAQSETLYAYVGSWTQGPFGVGGGGGITIFTVDMTDGALTRIGHTGPEFENMNAGYLAVSPNQRFLYATNEVKNLHGEFGGGGGLVSFAIDPDDGSITHMNTVQSMGVNPAFVTIDATGTRVLTSNHGNYDPVVRVTEVNGVPEIEKVYDDGTVAIYPVNDDGTLEPASDVAVLERISSVDPVAQQSAHAHSVNFDPTNSFVVVCDKGGDRVYTYRIDPGSYTLEDEKFIQTEAGLSPRHSVFHPTAPYVFVINERGSTILSLEYELATHELSQVQSIPTIPPDFTARNTTADIRVHPNGRFLYGSNRGHDSIAIYSIDADSGELELIDIVSTLGQTPRNINFDPSGRYIYACNQGSNSVVTFEVDPDDGSLTPTGAQAAALKPACIKFVSV
ncbi:MAG: lactonase family protein [Gammaproteobacteria bacterium]